MSRRMLTFISTWHSAATAYDPTRHTRSFLLHCEKAVDAALGKKPDEPPKVHYNPSAKLASSVFARWLDGFACDIETPSLEDHRMLSLAVSGDWNEAMVWDLASPGIKGKLTPLRTALRNRRNGGTKKIVWQNGEFDIPIMTKWGWKIDLDSCWDTMIENAILFPDEPVNLNFLVSLVCDAEAWKHMRTGSELLFYNALDACYTFRVYLEGDKHYAEYEK